MLPVLTAGTPCSWRSGFQTALTQRILIFEKFVRALIEKGIIPGISILAGRGEEIIIKEHYGWKSLKPVEEKLTENTIYDTASLTKPLITALTVVYLIEKKEIALDGEINRYLPGLPFAITISQLLSHTPGLPAWFPFYLYTKDYFGLFKTLPLETKPGKKVNYSCVGYILLFYLIEKVTGMGFKDFVQQVIIDPLNLKNTFLRLPVDLMKMAAPTEEGNRFEKRMAQKKHTRQVENFNWREYIIRGEANDGNSHYLGGTAGNAGLFSTTEDLFRLSLEFFPATATLLKPGSIKLFRKNFTPRKQSHRTAGFKLNSSFITSGGKALSRHAIGHNGFTGTSLWLEPQNETKYILLSNRIHPEVTGFNFNRARRKLHSLIKKELETHLT
jgi:CubicO group peptidase (beta-lactamase class C family)